MKPTLIVFESIFCDYEFDLEVRKKFLQRWLLSIRQLSILAIPVNTVVHFVLYISEDKECEIRAVRELISELEPSDAALFKLVTYVHPPEGYGYDEAKHPDLIKNPNKVAPQRDRLFERAMLNTSIADYSRIVRMTLDDDDFLLHWQLEEIIRAADLAYRPDQIVAVGLPNQIVSYIEPGYADIVSMTHNLNGGKFYVSSTDLYEQQRVLSPWSIPEFFNAKNVERMAKVGVSLVTVRDNVPGMIYCRWGKNLSLYDKSGYYTKEFQRVEFNALDSMLPNLSNWIQQSMQTFRSPSNPVISHESARSTFAKPKLNWASKYRIWSPQPTSDKSNRVVAVFRSPTGQQATSNITHTDFRYIGSIPQLKDVEENFVGFLQLRGSDGKRQQFSQRAKLRSVNQISQFSWDTWLSPVLSLPEHALELFENTLKMLSWIDSQSSRNYFMDLVADLPNQKQVAAQDSLLRFAFDITRDIPNKFIKNVIGHLWSYQLLQKYSGSRAIGSDATTNKPEYYPSTWANFSYQWQSIEQFHEELAVETSSGIHRISTDSYPIDLQIDAKISKPLVVVLHGRKAPEVKLPYLSGAGITSNLDVSRLSISDPSLYADPSLLISWFIGSSKQPKLQSNLKNIVSAVANALGSTRIIFVGGSAGGFASLVLSHDMEDSIALVWNPQTDFQKYYKGSVKSYLNGCWPEGAASIPKSVVTSAVDLYSSSPGNNLVLYMQEESDTHHIDEHLRPFEERVGPDSNILFYKAHWGSGHAPAPKSLINEVLSACLEDEPRDALKSIGFK